MTSPSGSRENESSLHVRLAQASILALGQSLRPDTPPGETPFVLIPGMMPYSYDDTACALASKSRPMVLYGFRALGALVIGTWRASEELERFAWQARGDQQMTRSTAHLYGRQDDAKFLVQWGVENVVLSLDEALLWPTEFQLLFCDWTHRRATPAERQLGADVVLSFQRPPDQLGGISGGPLQR